MPTIHDAHILIMAADGFEQLELIVPRDELRKEGAKVDVATPSGSAIKDWNKTDWGETAPADLKISAVDPSRYDALVLPGGVINPDKLRVDEEAMNLVKTFLAERSRTMGVSRHLPDIEAPSPTFRLLTKRSVAPDEAEIAGNPRARSAKLRAGERSAAPPRQADLEALLPRLPALTDIVRGG